MRDPAPSRLHRLSHSPGRLVWVPRRVGGYLHRQRQAAVAAASAAPAVGPYSGGGARPRRACAVRRGGPAGARPAPEVPKAAPFPAATDPRGASSGQLSSAFALRTSTSTAVRYHAGPRERPAPAKGHPVALLHRWPKPSGRGPRGRRPLLPALVELQVQEQQRSSRLQPSKFSLSVSLFLESRREETSLGRPRFESRLSKLLCILAAGPWTKKSLDLSESRVQEFCKEVPEMWSCWFAGCPHSQSPSSCGRSVLRC
ncbi:uncharacterized protein [Bos taurus]|uniref:uncharacterized protein n=1 Tax=Bos taurus TaxID=9913 RepID=UPI0028CB1C18|nr:uncharacterized protein LOC132345594 [Bos taurus]